MANNYRSEANAAKLTACMGKKKANKKTANDCYIFK